MIAVIIMVNRNEIRAFPLRSSWTMAGGGWGRGEVLVGPNRKPKVKQDW